MKSIYSKIFYLVLTSVISNNIKCSFNGSDNFPYQSQCLGRSIFIPRSTGANTARELVGWQNQIHNSKFVYSGSIGYARSYQATQLAQYILGNDILNFSGSQVSNRNSYDIVADYFGLPTDFQGSIYIKPVIANFILDTQLFIPLDYFCNKLYLELHAPLNYTRWSVDYDELTSTTTEFATEFPAGYMQNSITSTYQNIKQALFSQNGFGDVQNRKYGNFSCNTLTETRIADIDLILGYDLVRCKDQDYNDHKFSIFAQTVIPTGNKPDPKYIFTPIAGNGKHWEFGVGFFAKLGLWQDGCNRHLGLFFLGNLTHMFACNQQRSFDLCKNGMLSRYMLVKEFDQSGTAFTGTSMPAINFTTRNVSVSVPVKGDLSIKLSYKSKRLNMDLGYNFYGHSTEHLCLSTNKDNINVGAKSTQGDYYLKYNVVVDNFGSFDSFQLQNSTVSDATIFTISNNINNPIAAVSDADYIGVAWDNQISTGSILNPEIIQAFNSNEPVLINDKDLNLISGRACPTATNKFFGYIGYDSLDWPKQCVTGQFGLAGEIEFNALARNFKSSLNQWTIYLKGGITY